MKNPVSHDQMIMIVERATRERNAAVAALVAALPRRAIAWMATSADKFRQARAATQSSHHLRGLSTHLRYFGASANL